MKISKTDKILGAILILCLIFMIAIILGYVSKLPIEKAEDSNSTEIGKLENIVKQLVKKTDLGYADNNSANCRHHTEYYKYYLEDYYEDIKVETPIEYLDVKNKSKPHTFVIVYGYGSYCILDQGQYWCMKLKNMEKLK